MTKKVFALDTKPGVQRDGTVFDKQFYTDGRWVRFQRGRPRKINGYREITNELAGPSRGIYVNPQNNFNDIFSGYNGGLQKIPVNNVGLGSGISNLTLSNFTESDYNLWQFDGFYDVSGSGNSLLLAHPGQNLGLIDSTINTPVLSGDINGSSLSQVGVFTATAITTNGLNELTLSAANPLIGAGQTVTGSGIPASTTVVANNSVNKNLASVTVTGTSGTFSCTSTSGLFVGQSVTVSGLPSVQALAGVAITGASGTFSCTSTTGLYVGQPVTVSGTQTGVALTGVAVTGTAGQCSCTATNGLYIGQRVVVSGTLTGTATGITTGYTYYIIDTDGTSVFTLSATQGGTAITTTAGTTTGLVFTVELFTGVFSGTTYYITATNGTSTFTLSATENGPALVTAANAVTGLTFSVPKSTGLTSGTTYYIIATNFSTTFTLSATSGGSAITTIVNSTTGMTFTLGVFTGITISNNASASASVTLTFNNNVSVSGGVVSLHPYVFVFGNNGLIRNCSAGNANDWVSADANSVNVATGKIVAGLPVRGGSNAPSGLFWSLDSLVRVSYIGGAGTPPQFWRYDIISSQSSILSSKCVIEYDGIYYWVGTDRFLLYNGTVKEIPNSFNQNYFFDNLNYEQRQKVYVNKVPRFGEIWWFYPRGDATECNDAIIFNVREQVWYDAGSALGARRSAGYFSQVFKYPVNSGHELNDVGGINSFTFTAGSGYTNGTYYFSQLTGGTGTDAEVTIVVSGGAVTSVTFSGRGKNYTVGDVLTYPSLPAGSNFTLTVTSLLDYTSLWQHEVGTDEVKGVQSNAIESYVETNDLGWVSGGPSVVAADGINRWLRLERVEPDFIQSGEMELFVTGSAFAQGSDETSAAYPFTPDTGKIDMREQRRELRLKFVSNVSGGNYQMGKVILSADIGDSRPYGS